MWEQPEANCSLSSWIAAASMETTLAAREHRDILQFTVRSPSYQTCFLLAEMLPITAFAEQDGSPTFLRKIKEVSETATSGLRLLADGTCALLSRRSSQCLHINLRQCKRLFRRHVLFGTLSGSNLVEASRAGVGLVFEGTTSKRVSEEGRPFPP